ncbi:MAG: hypothetical protein ACI9TY_000615 [Alphaproteobacteria bacterium]
MGVGQKYILGVVAVAVVWFGHPYALDAYKQYKEEHKKQEQEDKRLALLANSEKSYKEYKKRKQAHEEKFRPIRIEGFKSDIKHQTKFRKDALVRYKEDNNNVNSLYSLTQTSWLISRSLKNLGQDEESQKEYDLARKYLKEFDEKMTEGWKDESFRENKQHEVRSIIKFYHHLYEDMDMSYKWRKIYLEHLLNKWESGQKDRDTACWIHNMYSTLHSHTPFSDYDMKGEWRKKSNQWFNSVIKTLPPEKGRKRQCNMPYYF